VIIACNAAPARCSVAAMVASRSAGSGQHLDGQLLQPPVMLGPLTTTSHPAVRREQARGLVRRQVDS
jgi:hypothetical protein